MQRRTIIAGAIGSAAAAGILALIRHDGAGRTVEGGILLDDAAGYDRHTRLLLGSFYDRIAAEIASLAPSGARVLDVGCGPGHLSMRLAGRHGLDVTGVDLDPAMLARATAHAARLSSHRPAFVAADAAALPFDDTSFDLVVSTLSLHHWADSRAGLGEIARVLSPGGQALIWDIRPGIVPLHRHLPDPASQVAGGPLELISASPWRWPWRLALTQLLVLRRPDDASEPAAPSG